MSRIRMASSSIVSVIRKFKALLLEGRPMVGLQTLDLAIGVRVPASQPNRIKHLRALTFESPVFRALCKPCGNIFWPPFFR